MRRRRREDDDGFHLAGWMYADVFVGLFVLVVAGVPLTMATLDPEPAEAVAEPSPSPSPSPTPSPSPSPTVTEEPESIECRGLFAPEERAVVVDVPLQAALDGTVDTSALFSDALERAGFPSDSELGFVLLFGHSSSGSTSEGVRRSRALEASLLDDPRAPLGKAASRAYYGGADKPDGTVEVELFPFVNLCDE